jgi:hypothetical protein
MMDVEQINDVLALNISDKTINYIVAFILGFYGFLRPDDNYNLKFENVKKINDPLSKCDKCKCKFRFSLKRKKQTSVNSDFKFFIIGRKNNCESCIILSYYNLILDKKGNFSKKIILKDGKLFSTGENWGKNNFYNIGKFLAQEIGLLQPQKYTGQGLRSTGATVGADSGMSVLELMNKGGWKSLNVAQMYIHKSNMFNERSTQLQSNFLQQSFDSKEKIKQLNENEQNGIPKIKIKNEQNGTIDDPIILDDEIIKNEPIILDDEIIKFLDKPEYNRNIDDEIIINFSQFKAKKRKITINITSEDGKIIKSVINK